MDSGARAEWFSVFEVYFAARLRGEFPDADWIFLVNDPSARVAAMPRGSTMKVKVSLPADFLANAPYLVAAMVAAQVRTTAEEMGLAPRRRTLPSKKNSGEFQPA